jgi:zinc transporter ZupT
MSIFPIMLSGIAAFLATLSAGIFAAKYKRHLGLVCAFTAGLLVALAFFDMAPDIMTLAPKVQVAIEMPLLTAIIGFFFLYALDHGLFQTLKTDRRVSKKNYKPTLGTLSAIEFSGHGFIEGLAIGISFQFQWSLGLIVAVAVISHDFCDGMSTLTLMLNSGNSVKSSMIMLFLDAIAPVAGAFATLFFFVPDYYLVFALAFLVGSFVYMSVGNLLPEAYRKNTPIATFVFFFAGVIAIFLISKLINA